jgi:hypothetical protein
MKTFIVKERKDFRLVGKKTVCLKPEELYSLELTGECLDDRGEVADRSTYNFFLNKEEIQQLCQNLLND